jgi:pyrroloquinoline quinone biosynthesis protein D
MSSVDLHGRPVLAAYVRLKIDPVTQEPVLVFPEGILILNSTARDIVALCDGRDTGEEILAALAAQFEADEATLRADVIECLGDLAQRNLVVWKS